MTIQERVAAVRRDHILDAATRVFAAKGFSGATIRDVARLAGVADGTIYNYFENKEALLFAILVRLNETERRQQQITLAAGADLGEFVRAYVRHRFDVIERVGFDAFQVLTAQLLVNPDLRARYLRDVLEPTFTIAEAAAQRWPGAAERTPDQVRLLTRAQAALVLGLLVLRLLGDSVLSERWDAVPDLVTDLILASIGGQHATGHPG